MKRNKKKNMVPSLHGDIMINTRSNRQPRAVIGYAAEPAGPGGGRLWRLHANGSASWVADTVLFSTAESMATESNEALGYKA
jgi:hypothetical protein